ncbi:hypothetical protein Hypma_009250 [Hypsizygus marmoreus]|uniref:Secreted protein n=1 Tax=Hypsizygus marmoreus TaxID=39966 RepID=A0A369JTA3_HYPMA|nr:hypothetical protein Hypma_009250 [Hypsizygus marmoreus]
MQTPSQWVLVLVPFSTPVFWVDASINIDMAITCFDSSQMNSIVHVQSSESQHQKRVQSISTHVSYE